MEAFKTDAHILNRVPSKSVPKMPYELWKDRKLILNNLHVWGCSDEAKVFNSNIGKLDPKTLSCHFISFSDKSKGFCFYYTDRHTKFVEMRYAVFLDDEMIRRSMVSWDISLEEKWVYVPTPMIQEPYFSMPANVTPIVHDNVIATPVVTSPMVEIDEEEEPGF
jgi:hypothetical protein